jgi:hypothetical protein
MDINIKGNYCYNYILAKLYVNVILIVGMLRLWWQFQMKLLLVALERNIVGFLTARMMSRGKISQLKNLVENQWTVQ